MATDPATQRPAGAVSFDEAFALVAELARPESRRHIVDVLTRGGAATAAEGLAALRECMRAHTWDAASGTIALRRAVDSLDSRTRREGLHVLHGWDYTTHKRPAEIAAVLQLDYAARIGVAEGRASAAVAVLLEQYCVALLGLLLVRVWDGEDAAVAGTRVDRIDALLRELHGPGGSGHPVIGDSGALLMLAVAYFHPEESAYADLLKRVWTLDATHRTRLVTPCAGIMASHLRWGLRFMYRADLGAMRADNAVDYPWSLTALLTLLRAYAAGSAPATAGTAGAAGAAGRAAAVAGLLNGLAADPLAFTGKAPAFLADWGAEHAELREGLARHRDALLADFAALAPSAKAFSPLAFSCNFVSNASVAMVTLACAEDTAHPPLNALFAPVPGDTSTGEARERMARRLMEYASVPERLGAGGAPLIAYDPYDGVHHYNAVVRALKTA